MSTHDKQDLSQNPAKGSRLVIYEADATIELHDAVERYAAIVRQKGRKLNKSEAAAELLRSGLVERGLLS